MKIQINKVNGNTEKKGAKQNKVYTIVGNFGMNYDEKHKRWFDLTDFHQAVDEKGRKFTIWNPRKDWSVIQLRRDGFLKGTNIKSTEFKIIEL